MPFTNTALRLERLECRTKELEDSLYEARQEVEQRLGALEQALAAHLRATDALPNRRPDPIDQEIVEAWFAHFRLSDLEYRGDTEEFLEWSRDSEPFAPVETATAWHRPEVIIRKKT